MASKKNHKARAKFEYRKGSNHGRGRKAMNAKRRRRK